MKKTSVFLILFILFVGKTFTQIPILTPSGPIIPNFYPHISDNEIIENDENTILSHHVVDYTTLFKKMNLEHLISYSKDEKKVKIQELVVPNAKETNHLFTRKIGDDIIIYYAEQSKKDNQFIVKTTTLSQDISTGKKNINLNSLFSFNIGDKESVKYQAVESPDKSKHAFLFIILDRKNVIQKFTIMVFDDRGEYLWQENYNPNFSDKETTMSDFKLTDDGKALLLVLSSSGKKRDVPDLQLISFHENEQITMDVEISEEIIQSMKMLILSNDTYFVGGYYAEKKSTTVGYFSMVFDPRSEALLHKNFSRFNDDYNEKGVLGFGKLAYVNQRYNVKCDYLFELDNGSVAMLGEQHFSFAVTNSKGLTTYRYFKKHIICNIFSLDGDKRGYEMIKRSQAFVLGVPVYDLSRFGLSYSPFIKGSDVYLLYNDNIKNFNGKSKNWETLNIAHSKTACTVLAKISDIGNAQRKVVMLPNKDGRIFHKLWAFDGERAFFGIMSKKLYSLEQFEVNDQWNWD